ncbi:hypothetical protein CN374_29215 [Bacillus cereus]|nr:hypothetical protein CN374_29215 [Bacillus cereus]
MSLFNKGNLKVVSVEPEYYLNDLSSITIEDQDGSGKSNYRVFKIFKVKSVYNANIHTKQVFANLVRWTTRMKYTSFVVLSGYSKSEGFALCYGLLREYSSKPSIFEKGTLNRDFDDLKEEFKKAYKRLDISDLTRDDAWLIDSLRNYSNVLMVRGIPKGDERLVDPLKISPPDPLNPSRQKGMIPNDTLGLFLELLTGPYKREPYPFLMYTVIDKEKKEDVVNLALKTKDDYDILVKKEYQHRSNLADIHDDYLSYRTFVLAMDGKSMQEVKDSLEIAPNRSFPFDIQIEDIPQADLPRIGPYVKSMRKPLQKERRQQFPEGLENYRYCTFITPEEAAGFDLPKKHLPGYSSFRLQEEIEISYFHVKQNEKKTELIKRSDFQDVIVPLYNFIGRENIESVRVKKRDY